MRLFEGWQTDQLHSMFLRAVVIQCWETDCSLVIHVGSSFWVRWMFILNLVVQQFLENHSEPHPESFLMEDP